MSALRPGARRGIGQLDRDRRRGGRCDVDIRNVGDDNACDGLRLGTSNRFARRRNRRRGRCQNRQLRRFGGHHCRCWNDNAWRPDLHCAFGASGWLALGIPPSHRQRGDRQHGDAATRQQRQNARSCRRHLRCDREKSRAFNPLARPSSGGRRLQPFAGTVPLRESQIVSRTAELAALRIARTLAVATSSSMPTPQTVRPSDVVHSR